MKRGTRGLWTAALCACMLLCGPAGVSLAAPERPEAGQSPAAAALEASQVAQPVMSDLPELPTAAPGTVRLMSTPRARIELRERVCDPRVLVERSGRMGQGFSFRSIAAGIVEFLFPGQGVFRRGEPLFRLYDPQVLADLAAAEAALRDYDVRPLLIAAPPPRRAAQPAPPAPSVPPPPAERPAHRSAAAPAPPVPAQMRPAAPARQATPAPAPAPAEDASASLRRASAEPLIDREPLEQAIKQAQVALREAEEAVATFREDYGAKQKLVDLGAIAAQAGEAAATALAEARSRQADAQARLDMARGRLAEAEQRNQARADALVQAAQAARQEQGAGSGVQVVRGPQANQSAPAVEVVRGPAPPREPERPASPPAQAAPARTPTAPARTPEPPPGPRPTARRDAADLEYRGVSDFISRTFPPTPRELDRLSEERWTEYRAPADGFILERAVADGDTIDPGQEVLRVVNTQWARTYFTVSLHDAHRFLPGTVLSLTFDDYPDVLFEGWINSLEYERNADTARAELVVFCRAGYYGTDAFATLQWLALATPLEQASAAVPPVEPVVEDCPERHYDRNPVAALSLVPRGVWTLSVDEADLKRSERFYAGQLQLVDLESAGGSEADGEGRARLAQLKRWREGFVDGMTRTIFDDKVILTYPRSGEIRQAIERMATGRVTNIPNRCARTMREALGWGLGDAHVWARELPRRGYTARTDGLARPGDILVWPFSYPPRNTQHIGIAVQQNGRLMLLSNLNGELGTSDVRPGYVAFHRPADQ